MYLPPELIDAVCRHSASHDSTFFAYPQSTSHPCSRSTLSALSSTHATTSEGVDTHGLRVGKRRPNPRSTLLALSLTSSMFVASAQRELFRDIRVIVLPSASSSSASCACSTCSITSSTSLDTASSSSQATQASSTFTSTSTSSTHVHVQSSAPLGRCHSHLHLNTTDNSSNNKPTYPLLQHLLAILHSSPHLARYLRKFELRAQTEEIHGGGGAAIHPSLGGGEGEGDGWPILYGLERALLNMTCLKDLVIALPPSFNKRTSPSYILPPTAPPTLRLLSASFPLDANVVRFLSGPPNGSGVEEIWLAPREESLDETTQRAGEGEAAAEDGKERGTRLRLDRLQVFAGDVEDALRLLSPSLPPSSSPSSSSSHPHRGSSGSARTNLRAMYLRSGVVDASNLTRVLRLLGSDSESTDMTLHDDEEDEEDAGKGNLEILELNTSLDPLYILEHLSAWKTLRRGLRCLRIEVAGLVPGGRGGIVLRMDLYERIATHLSRFARLETFNLSGIHWGSSPSPSPSPTPGSSSYPQRQWQTSSLLTHPSSPGSTSGGGGGVGVITNSSPSSPALAPAQLAPSIAEEYERALGLDLDGGAGPSEDVNVGEGDEGEGDEGEGDGFEGSGDALFFEF